MFSGKTVSIGLLVAAIALVIAGVREWRARPDDKLHVTFLYGHAVLIKTPTNQIILVDPGSDAGILEDLGKLLPPSTRTIDLVLQTSSRAAEGTLLADIATHYHLSTVVFPKSAERAAGYARFIDILANDATTVTAIDEPAIIDADNGLRFSMIVPPPSGKTAAPLLVQVLYKEHRILLTGDMTIKAGENLAASDADLHSDVLQIAHDKTATGFLLKVHPTLAVINLWGTSAAGHQLYAMGILFRSTRSENITLDFE